MDGICSSAQVSLQSLHKAAAITTRSSMSLTVPRSRSTAGPKSRMQSYLLSSLATLNRFLSEDRSLNRNSNLTGAENTEYYTVT